MGKKKTHEEFVKELCDIYNITTNDFEISEYKGWDKEIVFTCKRCGLQKIVNADSLRRIKGKKKNICRCYSYGDDYLETKKRFDEWVLKQQDYSLLETFSGVTKNILVKCKKCGAEQRRSVKSLLQEDGCLVCEKKVSIKKTREQFMMELQEKYGGEYELVGEYLDMTTPTLFRHTLCGKIYKTKPHYIMTNKGGHCPVCKIKSKGEILIENFLAQHNINYIPQFRLENFKKAPYDFYLPDYNLLIEFQGIQHFQPVERFGGRPSFLRQKEIDENKKLLAEELNYSFLEISYLSIKDIEQILIQRLSLGREQE